MKNESFDQVFQLGMVAVKVIILFLLVMVSILLGIIWYRSELEINFLINNSVDDSAEVTTPNEEIPAEDLDSTSSDSIFTDEREVTGTVLEIDTVSSTITIEFPGGEATVVAYTEETVVVSETSEEADVSITPVAEPIALADIAVGDAIVLQVTAESLLDGEDLVAEQITLTSVE